MAPKTLLPICVQAQMLLPLCAAAADDELAALQKVVPRFSASGTLDAVLEKLSRTCGVRIETDWPAVSASGVDRRARITVAADNARGDQLLDFALSQSAAKDHPLAWFLDARTARVTTQDRVIYRHSLARLDGPASQPAAGKAAAVRTNSYTFDNTPLSDVIEMVRQVSGANFDVNWKSLEECGLAKDTPVTLQLREVTPARLLDLVLDQVSGGKDKFSRPYWVINDGVVTVASGNALNNDLTTRVFDVTDLLMVVPNFKGPTLDMSTVGGNSSSNGASNTLFGNSAGQGSGNSSDASDNNMAEQRAKVRDSLMAAIKNSIGDEMWKPDGKGSVMLVGNKLVISQTLLGFKLMENSGRKR